MKPESELIRGIEEQTQAEIDSLTAKLETIEHDRYAAADREIDQVRREIEQRAEAHRKRIDMAAKAALATERHKIQLESSNRFFDEVLRESERRLRELAADERYEAILKKWIVEAAAGLAADDAVVSVSPEERSLCAKLLKDAEKETEKLVGRKVRLKMAEEDTRDGQGAVLTAVSGRTAFNNQVKTRMLRKETEVRRIIYDELSSRLRGAATESTLHMEKEHNDG